MSSAKRTLVLVSVAGLVTLSLAGCPTPTPTPTGDATAGAALFAARCIGCHNPASTVATARNAITNNMGTVNAAMDGVTLTDQEVADLQAYLATQVTTPTGNATNGSALFATRCAGCHSASAVAGGRALITTNLGTISAAMNGITLTDQEVLDVQAYLATQ
jgi:mono/diheme cytochrome c family protein